MKPENRTPLGIIAGEGRLPVLLAQEARKSRPLVVVSIAEETVPELAEWASVLKRVHVGKIGGILRAFQDEGVQEIVMLGGVPKSVLFQPHKFDLTAWKILARTKKRGDQALFRSIAEEFEAHGFRIADQRDYLSPYLPTPGVLTRRKPTKSQQEDAEYAMELARQVAALDIGQTVVIKDGIPLAVEAIEGTDAAILRGGLLGKGGVVVAKAARPGHDFRFDVPTVGTATFKSLREAAASALVVEAGRTFLLDRDEFLAEADGMKLVVIAL